MSDFIPFKEFHKNTNLSYQQLLRTFHKVRKDKDSLLSEGEDYRYEGKDDERGRTGILFLNPVLIFPKLKKQRVELVYMESPEVSDETAVKLHETENKKDALENGVSDGFKEESDETVVESSDSTKDVPYKKLFEKEQGEHAKTREKLEKKGTELLEYAERASRLEGEKIGDEKLRIEQSRIIKMLTDKMLKIQSPSPKDAFSQKPKDVQRQPEPTLVVSKVRPKFKRKKQTLKKSNRTLKNNESKEEKLKLRVKSKPEREQKTKEKPQPKKSGFWKRLKWLLALDS
jgi:hypothetical protein